MFTIFVFCLNFSMNISLYPINKRVFGRGREVLIEKYKVPHISPEIYVLEFSGKYGIDKFIVKSKASLFLVPMIHLDANFSFQILYNIGDTTGIDFIEWVEHSIINKEKFLNQSNATVYKNISIFSVTKNGLLDKKYCLTDCQINSAVFFEYKKDNPQIAFTISVKDSRTYFLDNLIYV